jgi:hypothetical protein
MVPADLDAYPALAAAYRDIIAPRPLAGTFMARVLHRSKLSHGFDSGFKIADGALAVLGKRFTHKQLQEQIEPLFGVTLANWEMAITELLGLQRIAEVGLLDKVGWPPPSGTKRKNAEFDGLLVDLGGGPIAFDIKSGAKSGLQLLKDALREQVDKWTAARNLPEGDVRLEFHGSPAREVVGPAKKRLARELRDYLDSKTAFPSGTLEMSVGNGTTVTVTVSESTGASFDSAGFGLDHHAEQLEGTYREHIMDKGEHAKAFDVPFLMVYVKPRGFGISDMSEDAVEAAIRDLHQGAPMDGVPNQERWLGTLLFEVPGLKPLYHGLLRPDAAWPRGTTPEMLRDRLQLDLWPLQKQVKTVAAF